MFVPSINADIASDFDPLLVVDSIAKVNKYCNY
jgi:hypothetical protein